MKCKCKCRLRGLQCKGIPSRGRGLRNNNEFVGRWFVGGGGLAGGWFVGGLRLGCVCVGGGGVR